MAQNSREDTIINTVLGPGSVFNGSVSVPGFVRLDGHMKGNLEAKGKVVIGENARLRGDLSGTNVIIGGVVYGNVYASERVNVLSTAIVLGDIITRFIKAEQGTLIHGKVIACGVAENWKKRLSAWKDEKSILKAARPQDDSHGQS